MDKKTMEQKEKLLNKMVSDQLKSLRLERKYTQQEVADKINISRSTYAGYEGKNMPDTFALIRLARLYSVSTDSILFGINEKFSIPCEFKEITSNLTSDNRDMFWTHLLEYAKYLSRK